MDERNNTDTPKLTTCPICGSLNWSGLRVCHVCGFPFGDEMTGKQVAVAPIPPATRPYRKRKRTRANGTGSITKLPNRNLKRPWRVQITVGTKYDEQTGKTKQIRKNLGMYETRVEAEASLSRYLENPFDLSAKKATFSAVYSAWSRVKFPDLSRSRQLQYQAAYAICQPLHDALIAKLTPLELQAVVDDAAANGKNYSMLLLVKQLYSALYRFAVDNCLCARDASSSVTVKRYEGKNPNSITRTVFSDDEIARLWDAAAQDKNAEVVLFLIHSGLRISELFNLKCADVQGDSGLLTVTKSKTSSGLRTIPLPKKIMPIVQSRLALGHEFLFVNNHCNKWIDDNFRKSLWSPLMARLGMSHTPHDTRHSYVSILQAAAVPLPVIDKLVGHSGGLTIDTYTHFNDSELRKYVDLAFP